MRLFVAITFPDSLRDRLAAALRPVRDQVSGLRWLSADTYHITLKFLGRVEAEQLSDVQAGLLRAAGQAEPFALETGGLGAFPSLRRANVVWLGAAAGPPLNALQTAVESALAPLGFPTEARPFHAHVTVARLTPRTKPLDLTGMERLVTEDAYQQLRIQSIELMESKVSSKGARYEAIASAPLEK